MIVDCETSICLGAHEECSWSYIDNQNEFLIRCGCICHKQKEVKIISDSHKKVGCPSLQAATDPTRIIHLQKDHSRKETAFHHD
jgi:hypothetical protein